MNLGVDLGSTYSSFSTYNKDTQRRYVQPEPGGGGGDPVHCLPESEKSHSYRP